MKRLMVMMACCVLLNAAIGCNRGVVRGQNPGSMAFNGGMMPDQAGGHMQMPAGPVQPGPIYYDGPAGGGNGMTCPPCPQGAIDVWRPTHHHTWDYKAPQNLRYPPANQPPAVMQYPYYTCKGPTDFFYQGP